MKRLVSFGIVLTFFLSLVIFTPRAYAQNWVDEGYPEGLEEATQNGEVNSEGYVSKVQGDTMRDLIRNGLGPVAGVTVTSDVWERNPSYARGMYEKSAIAGINNYIVAMYSNPPANLALWINDTGQTLGFIPRQAHAQGIGFAGLAPLLPLWKAFRNIAYIILALIMVVIGFMVMLRKRIDPKTVVTVQNALPKIVMTLILITFSYAIVGIVIDLMYLAILLAVALIKTTGLLPEPDMWSQLTSFPNIESVMTTGSLFTVARTWGVTGFNLVDVAADLIGWKWYTSIGALAVGILTLNPIGITAGAVVAAVPVLLAFILFVAILFGFIRLLFMFFTAYIGIILSLLIGPIQLLGEAIPGSNTFSSWFKNLLSNVIVFPIAAVFFLISLVFSQAADTYSGSIWTPPFLTLPGASVSSISSLFSLGMLLTIPNVVNSIKEKLKAPPAVNAGPGAIFGPLGVGAGQAMQLGYQASFIASARRHPVKESTAPARLATAAKSDAIGQAIGTGE